MEQYKIHKNVILWEMFSGIGCQHMALKRLGIPLSDVVCSDWDVNAVKSYRAIHCQDSETEYDKDLTDKEVFDRLWDMNVSLDGKSPVTGESIKRKGIYWARNTYNDFRATNNLGSITHIHAGDLPYSDECTVMMTYSFPCFIEGTMVLTSNGYKEIQEVGQGDLVLTHTNSWQRVTKTFCHESNTLISINCIASEKIYCTPNHPFYVRKLSRTHNKKTGNSERSFSVPEWIEAKDLDTTYYLGTAINQIEEMPIWNTDSKNVLQSKITTEEFWYIVGRYIGDGWVHTDDSIIICDSEEEIGQMIPFLDKLNVKYAIYNEKTCKRIRIVCKEIGIYCQQFGKGASNKHLTSTVLNLPRNLLKSFIEGYIDADGTYTQGKFKVTCTSRRLIYEIAQCVNKAYNKPTAIYYTQRRNTVIEGRIVNQKDSYTLTYTLDKRSHDQSFYENGYIWSPINIVQEEEYNDLVYNLEVENDNSYQIQNVIVHNCQDLSNAGKQSGMDEGSGTRSSMLWEVGRILNECKEINHLPEVLLMENVPAIHNKKFNQNFQKWLSCLADLGYASHWQDLNARDYGVPQNRIRTFVLSILNEGDDEGYIFPEPIPLKKRLKDLLEDDVDEKYYIKSEKAEALIVDLQNRGVLNGTTAKKEAKNSSASILGEERDEICEVP